jgi:5'-nucleotidase/UDP-sugar diphosphatase
MKKKLLPLLLAVAMVFSLAACGEKKPEKGTDATATEPVVILHTNDVHGAIGGYAKVAALAQQYEADGAYVLILDAGDYSQGDPAVSLSQGATAVELMNLVGYDAAALGNHEFDYGFEVLKKNMESAQFPVLAANVKYNGELAFDDAAVFTTPGGTKIGVFGLDTPETATKAHPGKIQGVTFAGGEELYQIAQDMATMLREDEGCNYVICIGHLGIDDETAATANRSIDLLEKVTGIDVFIDGHSHSTEEEIAEKTNADRKVGETILTSTGTKLENIGVVTIKDSAITTECVPTEGIEIPADSAVAARAAAIIAEIEADYGTVFAKTEVTLNGEKDPGNRTQETNLGDLITDALVWGAEQQGETVDAAITNGGGIRATIEAGDITKKDVNTVLPFGNTLSIIKITGEELLEVLEASTFCTPEAIGGFPQVSGIEFTVDTTKSYDQGDEYPGTTYFAPKTINRVTIQTVGGKDFDPAATYTIATNDFMASGGDTYYRFVNATANYDLGVSLDEVLMDYITDALNGAVTAAQYGEPAGRIHVLVS